MADVQKQSRLSSSRGRSRTLAPTRSSLRLAARPSHVPVAQRAQRKLMRELDFINGQSLAPDAAVTEFVDMFGEDLPEQAIKAVSSGCRMKMVGSHFGKLEDADQLFLKAKLLWPLVVPLSM